MSKLADLGGRIEGLPALETKKKHNSKYLAFQKKVTTAYEELLLISGQCNCLGIVFHQVTLSESRKALRDTPRSARNLLEKIKINPTEIANTATNDKVTRFGERNASATSELRKKWKALLSDSLKSLIPLVAVARDANLPGHEDIDKRLNALETAAEQLPISTTKAEEHKRHLGELNDEVASLELEGPGGKFLVKAVAGQADPKDLLKEEVRNFLDEKELWQILVVCTVR